MPESDEIANTLVLGMDCVIDGDVANAVLVGRGLLVDDGARNRVLIDVTWETNWEPGPPFGVGLHRAALYSGGVNTGIPEGTGPTADIAVADAQVKLFELLAVEIGKRRDALLWRCQMSSRGDYMREPDLDNVGREAAPAHYAGTREVIDQIRDALGDDGFIAFCLGNAMKYRARAGKKAAAEGEDVAKAEWYEQMAAHVEAAMSGDGASFPDPRSARPDFKPYEAAP